MDTQDENQIDVALMQRLRAGDDLALNELMARWQKALTSFVFRYTGNEADTLDLAQETFVHLYESRGRYEPRSKFSTYLFTIAGNICRNFERWQRRHPTISLQGQCAKEDAALERLLPSESESPSDTADHHDVAGAVREQIQKLPHDLRTVVLLFEYEEMSYQEIGAVLGCSPKAVETRLYRARKSLRESLARFGLSTKKTAPP